MESLEQLPRGEVVNLPAAGARQGLAAEGQHGGAGPGVAAASQARAPGSGGGRGARRQPCANRGYAKPASPGVPLTERPPPPPPPAPTPSPVARRAYILPTDSLFF